MYAALFAITKVCMRPRFYVRFSWVKRSDYNLGVLHWPLRAVLSSNRDTHCSHLALHGRVQAWQKAAEAPSVDAKRSFNIMRVTFNWKQLTKGLPLYVAGESNKK